MDMARLYVGACDKQVHGLIGLAERTISVR